MGGETRSVVAVFGFEQLCDRCLGNLELVERVVSAFTEGFAADLARLESELRAGAWEDVRRLAHRMKGSASNAAAGALERVVGELEGLAREGREEALAAKVAELRREWTRFEQQRRRGED